MKKSILILSLTIVSFSFVESLKADVLAADPCTDGDPNCESDYIDSIRNHTSGQLEHSGIVSKIKRKYNEL